MSQPKSSQSNQLNPAASEVLQEAPMTSRHQQMKCLISGEYNSVQMARSVRSGSTEALIFSDLTA